MTVLQMVQLLIYFGYVLGRHLGYFYKIGKGLNCVSVYLFLDLLDLLLVVS